ncbi:hypothetical protein BX666DRAFT_1855233 [Dichotomocladium elegans]|nr:hypothetical protein BX666DRAFT_1855233 [Dichotomocladium elegans]
MLICTVGIPLGLYYGLRGPLGTLWALIISGVPALLHVAYVAIRQRKIDILGSLIVVAFVVSGVISIVTGDVRAAILRDSAVTATVSLLFFVTLIPIRNKWIRNFPLTYLMGCQIFYDAMPPYHWYDPHGVRHQLPLSDFLWNYISQVRVGHRLITFGWFFCLMGEFVARVVMVEATTLTAEQIINYGNIIVGAVTGVMTASTIIISIKVRQATIAWIKENDHTRKFASPPSDA